MTKLVLGAFPDRRQANEGVMELEEAGASSNDFSIIAPQAAYKDSPAKPSSVADGAAFGGVAGGLAGLTAGAIATAGVVVAGPVAVLAGLGWVALTTATGSVVGALAGGMVGALVGLGVPEETARYHESVFKEGGVILGVDDEEVSEEEIRRCFEKHGAERIVAIQHGVIPARMAATM